MCDGVKNALAKSVQITSKATPFSIMLVHSSKHEILTNEISHTSNLALRKPKRLTAKPLYSGHHRDREKVSAIGRYPLYIEFNLEGFLRIGSKIVSAIEIRCMGCQLGGLTVDGV